ncbi:hypothetical protein SAMN04487910_2081 [Aquimarina amphilecti]|uniref:Tetratricopeptide repeat-containing protein n=1 Tax=Aquimarina amphilecti TaxID=1038014 RepID=A0A1H7NGQ2_AQUAM|nr:hypothetical protein [Aquimarina amphilecti]SEL22614.1 hypothetical protein SAMN04487910_2081 [Aquimarina amphilecti]
MTPEEKYELFERKISGGLSVKEQEVLSRILREDESIAEEFRLYQEWSSYLETNLNVEEERSDLEKNLKNISNSFFEKKPLKKEYKVIKIPSWTYAVAASVAILLGVYMAFNENDASYNDFASIPELSIIERSSGGELIKKAEKTFNSKNYLEAEKYLSELLKNNDDNSEYSFYLGIALVEQNKYDKASEVFGKLQKGTSVYKYRATWFEALNQLKQGKKDKCKVLLELLPNEAEDYQQAQKLLKKI